MTKKKKPVELPDKSSELLFLAVADARKAAKDPKYTLDMRVYHHPNGTCRVCMAGSVMAMTLKASPEKLVETSDFTGDICRKLHRIDEMRTGIFHGHGAVTQQQERTMRTVGIMISYEQRQSRLFRASWRTYEKAAKMLAAVGL